MLLLFPALYMRGRTVRRFFFLFFFFIKKKKKREEKVPVSQLIYFSTYIQACYVPVYRQNTAQTITIPIMKGRKVIGRVLLGDKWIPEVSTIYCCKCPLVKHWLWSWPWPLTSMWRNRQEKIVSSHQDSYQTSRYLQIMATQYCQNSHLIQLKRKWLSRLFVKRFVSSKAPLWCIFVKTWVSYTRLLCFQHQGQFPSDPYHNLTVSTMDSCTTQCSAWISKLLLDLHGKHHEVNTNDVKQFMGR